MSSRQHLATEWYSAAEHRSYLRCKCGMWRSDITQTMQEQRIAHRAHRVAMGETVKPLTPKPSERLAAAEAAVERVRALVESYPPGSEFARSGLQDLFRITLDPPSASTTQDTA
ncbi:hypothetical protein EDD29_0109 [Actinocorallia herbida]|uniref:Uncharacterized protein n=1 Tax=Actinocorallia herbida TaxID=58109 RepID=A0A3N1CPH7_9ACTN|nr:hypothetical protein [Actinocorallia herbida]ROO82628.1 hypothetical protein EDD29_0109 [Actinocorallia herbida]